MINLASLEFPFEKVCQVILKFVGLEVAAFFSIFLDFALHIICKANESISRFFLCLDLKQPFLDYPLGLFHQFNFFLGCQLFAQ